MSFNQIYDIAASGMSAQRLRVQLIAANVANSETTRTAGGGPYRKKEVTFQVQPMGQTSDGMPLTGVGVGQVLNSRDPFVAKYDPNHPDADAEGIVQYPNVNPVEEMVNLTEASRSYEANVAVIRAVRTMALSTVDLLRVT
ncbi:flagellar basal body rod protein FlgC [Holophaga foetida]|uniref:flagellar basal body rod protein FlgC n=1 Tax=Holophaga foetida TaxID=35839 RepID=UPI00024742E6|nr:flagellar basal body rod protein FlgC [Holophaga foetida]